MEILKVTSAVVLFLKGIGTWVTTSDSWPASALGKPGKMPGPMRLGRPIVILFIGPLGLASTNGPCAPQIPLNFNVVKLQ